MTKRIFAAFLAAVMLVTVMPLQVFAASSDELQARMQSSVMENTNQSDGVVMRKTAMLHEENGKPDGTVDVIIEAYTTGVVTQTTTSVPTDIVLVLDVSGSMDNVHSSTSVTSYNTVNGSTQYRWTGGMRYDTVYGMSSTSTTYYININMGTEAEPHYVELHRQGTDSGKYDYYYYYGANDAPVYVYPQLNDNPNEARQFRYPIVQFYQYSTQKINVTFMEALKTAVTSFIETTHQKNAQIAQDNPTLQGAALEALQHRISIVKFASDSYYGGTASVTEGNNKNTSGYNYSQVVKNLTVANGAGHETLISSVNALTAGGATSIDYGLTLAQMVLAPTNAGTAQRNKVVLVFSDGEPNHYNGFDTTVANTAINLAKNIKQTAKVYSISVAPNTNVNDTTTNLNKFFHYVSSNYPNASNLTTPGANGNSSAGYYMVPSSSESLEMIFQAIAQQIESPTIELGESAEVVDTMSTFFTIPDGTNSVSLYKSDREKNADGTWSWSEAIPDTGLSCTVQGKTVQVHGFDYDENYVSDTARTKNGRDYYGTALIIKINATPDYDMIDTHASLIQDGKIPSNDGTANLLNTAGMPVAAVETPYIQANTVTYQYTDPVTKQTVTFRTQYRLPGGETAVSNDVPVIHGYTFGGWTTTDVSVASDGSYTMPEKNIVFKGTFTANKHNVTYTITGYNPGATAPAGLSDVAFGTDVTVAADLTYPGYTFTGWQSTNPAITADQATFTMPDRDVELIGYFTANTGIPYKTIHYVQNLDGTYSVRETVNGAGTTDAAVTAAVRVYEGFTLDTTVMGATVTGVSGTVNTVSSGKVSADGQFTMHQFHTRNKYTVTYAYEGSVPGTAPALPITKEYYHGQTVTVESHTAQDAVLDQTFAGWHTLDKTTVTDEITEFTMPIGNITLYGIFTLKENVPFHIHHYLQNADGSYPAIPNYTGTSYAVAGNAKFASDYIRTISGYTYAPDAAGSVKQGVVSENPTLTLKLYYTRNPYNVTYKYEGTVPAGATDLASYQMSGVLYGTSVTVGADATAPGYAFSGWRIESPASAVIRAGKFEMPASDVVLVGSFTARTNTPYRIEYYWQNANDNGYTLHEGQNLTGVTDATATIPVRTYAGFHLNDAASGTLTEGTITADGQLVLRRYYDRNTYQVKYAYEASSSSISNLPPLPEDTTAYRYGATVTVKPDVSRADYDFIGWYSKGSSAVAANTATFTMPIPQNGQYVTLWGEFFAKSDVPFTIEHYLIHANGTVPTVPYDVDKSHGVAGTTVQAADYVLSFTGYVFHHADPVQGVITEVAPGLVLKLYYVPNTYKVTYKYEGTVPAGATNLTSYQMSDVPYGTSVTVGADATAPGYIFSGWRVEAPVEAVVTGGQFTMPASDVVLVGSFTARTNTPYRIEYYWQNANDNGYTLHEGQDLTGVTDATATIPVRTYAGFHLNPTASGTLTEGTITADGQLVLRRYYDRNTYQVKYAYEASSSSISNLPPLPEDTTAYRYGATVTVKPDVSRADYDFIGWYSKGSSVVAANTATFTMPIPLNGQYVTLWGEFFAKSDVPFTIEHYLIGVDGTVPTAPYDVDKSHGVAGTTVQAADYVLSFTGYVFHHADPVQGVITEVAPGLVLKLYYVPDTYNVIYKYENGTLVPAGATDLTSYQMSDVPYGTSVTVGADATAPGYAFSGWRVEAPVEAVVTGGQFTMPASDVVLVGSFTARTNTPYRIEYYWQNANDNGYTLHEGQNLTGVTDTTATIPERTYVGFHLNPTASGTLTEGTITADGQLVLRRYYDRNTYRVEYAYEASTDTIPNRPALPVDTKEYRYGQTVTVAPVVSLTDYNFIGWYTKQNGTVTSAVTEFAMPIPYDGEKVTLWGDFAPMDDVQFTIEHYLQNTAGTDDYRLAVTAKSHGVTNAEVTAEAYKRTFTGYTFAHAEPATGKIQTGLVLKLYYNLNAHNVTYKYEGMVPVGATNLTSYQMSDVPYGTSVAVGADAEAAGYVFSGWTLVEPISTPVADGKFVMPDSDVVLVGSFEARTNNQYRVEYYWQNTTDDGFTLYETDTYNNGVTGATVYALEKSYTGLTLDKTLAGTLASGIVTPDNQLVLKLYYIRNTYTVEYKYESDVTGAPALPTTQTYRFGQTVSVAADAVLTNYDFVGWHTKAGAAVTVTATAVSFTMPAANVTLYGEFFAKKNVPFTVEHYLETGSGYTLEITDTFAGVAGSVVKADDYKRLFAGHTYDPAVADSVTQGAISEAPALVLKLYYTLNKHNVTYKYEGMVPVGATDLSTYKLSDVPYGTSVKVADPAKAAGYVFSGWTLVEPISTPVADGQFVMPDSDVVLVGSFEARTNNQYRVEYYWQNTTDDGFTLYETDTYNNGVTGATVYALEKTYPGLKLDTKVTGTKDNGIVTPDNQLVLKLYYIRNTYTVEYAYESDVAGAPALPTAKTYRFGQSVTVAADAVLEHYDFRGWYTKSAAFHVTTGMSSFAMPAEDLTLWGEFNRIEGVHYKVEHYLMDENGNYSAPILTEEFDDGIAGETVTGTPKKASVDNRFAGYVHDPAAAGSVLSGTVVASTDPDYPLTLKLYYKRNTYRVIYEYVGILPANRSPLPAAADAVYMSEVTVAPDATAEGYTFSGWTIQSPARVTVSEGKFEMPAHDVILVGSFNINPPYVVEYWLQTTDHQGYVKDEDASHTHTAPVGAAVEAHSMTFEGYTENKTHPDRVFSGTVPASGTLILKLFYDLVDYTVTYEFEGTVPAGAQLPGAETKHFGDTVTTPDPTLAGYTFSGWRSAEVGNVTAGETFLMPARSVVLKGSFIAGQVNYTIAHYLMNDKGNYEDVTPYTETKTGVVGDSVRANAYQTYLNMGAKIDADKTQAVDKWEGVVSATTPLVLELYYSREATSRVVYHYVDELTADQWRALGWPDLPTDSGAYYTGATVTALDVIGIKPDKAIFEGWFCSDPTILVAPGGTFTMPALTRADKTIHLYGKWVSTEPQEFTVKYFIDNMEQTHLTQTYPLNTSVTVMENLPSTSSHSYSGWSAPISVTSGVSVVMNADGTFTMTEHGEVHIRCTSTPVAPTEKYSVRYYLDGLLYWEGGYELFQRHFILPAPVLPMGVNFSGWSVPRTIHGSTVKVLGDGLGNAVFTMPADDVVIHGTTSLAPIPDGTMKIEKVVNAPADFAGGREYTFRIYQLIGDTKVLVHTETVKVNAKTGKGDSGYFDLPQGNNYLVEEVGAGVPGYALTTVATDANGNVIPYGATVTVKARLTPTVITFTNTYTDLSLETRDHFGYIIGYQDDTVRPEANITRAEVATIFFRLLTDAKRAEYWSKTNDFTDVAEDAWYNNAISTLAKAGALSGYEDGTFRPNQPITRAELVKIAMSFYGTVHSDSHVFNDVGEHWAAAFINGAADLGFVDGYGDETFQPDRYVTRAEAIKIINRTLNRAPDKDHLLPDMITWVDNADTNAWYYAEIQEATNSHTYTWDKTSEIWEKIRPVRDWSALEKRWSEANDGAK